MTEPGGRFIAEDLACPVEIHPGKDQGTPPDWTWRLIATSLPNAATFHLSHSDVGPVMIDVLRPSDTPPDAPFTVVKDIPIIILDSLDKYWAGESKQSLPLNGIRVPVEHDTIEGAKQALAADLAAQMRLLLLLSSSTRERKLAPQLSANLAMLSKFLKPRQNP
ncbi:MAG: hypothetical protein BZY75_03295 [SAR202 cluster bacterium Io17-Chloro-G7]|nr:MAG: hypothetical protein BZY75_03295 [SAR202 cluster bacterium Io17-Chloro-G7]